MLVDFSHASFYQPHAESTSEYEIHAESTCILYVFGGKVYFRCSWLPAVTTIYLHLG